MKNKQTLKIVGIFAIITLIATWIIPSTIFSGYDFTKGDIKPVGLWDFFTSFATTVQYFYQPGLLILAIGAFYALLVELGIIENLKVSFKNVFKGKEKWFVVLTVAFYMIMASVTGMYLPLLLFVPFSIAILLYLSYDKKTALLSTIGSIILGNGLVFFNSVVNETALNITKVSYLVHKDIILVLFIALYSFLILYKNKLKKNVKEEDDYSKLTLVDVTKTKKDIKVKSMVPFFIIMGIVVIALILGLTPIGQMFDTKIFQVYYDKLTTIKIGDFPIFKNLLGSSLPVFGAFQTTDVTILVLGATFLLWMIYMISFEDLVTIAVRGMKRVLPLALIAIFINTIIVFTLNTQFLPTIMQWLVNFANDLHKSMAKVDIDIKFLAIAFDWFTALVYNLFIIITTAISSIFMIDNVYVANYSMQIMANLVGSTISKELLVFVGQMGYAFGMLLGPTSVLLLVGLMYAEVPYKTWIKTIWKKALILLLFLLLAATIVAMI